MNEDVLEKIYTVLNERKSAAPESSYVASLYDKGIDAILKKVGEESTETILAAKDGNNEQIIHETADLWFHCLVMLAKYDITPTQILEELNSRFGVSGHTEKASRGQ